MKRLSILSFLLIISYWVSAQEYSTGMLFDDAKYEQAPEKPLLTTRSLGANVPQAASLKKYAPYPKSQGQTGTCVAWASAYAARTIVEAKNNNWTDRDLITQKALSPGFLYKHIKSSDDYSCQNGSYIDDAMKTMQTTGVPLYSTASELCYQSITPAWFNEAQKYKIDDYAKLFGGTEAKTYKLERVKKSLAEGNPVVFGMYVTHSFYNALELWTPTESPANNLGGHAMCLIGYDDNKYGGAFEIQNSWGTTWGNNGYTWVKYDDFVNFTKYAFEIISMKSAPKGNKFAGKIEYILPDGKTMDATYSGNLYNMNSPYPSGTQFRILITSEQPAFVYAFGTDATNQVFKIFPHKQNVSAALNYQKSEIPIPDEAHFIQMDNTVGNDYLCVIFSREQLDIDRDIAKLSIMSGNFADKIKIHFGDKIIPTNEINYQQNEISFTADATEKSMAVMLVKIQHTK